jgi:hypothetical protein
VRKTIGMIMLAMSVAGLAMAQTQPVPEVDPGSCASALVLISGALLVIRGRRKN